MKKLSKLTMLAGMFSLFAGASVAQDDTDIPSKVALFKNVKVFDGVNEGLQDLDVLVVQNKIHRVGEDIPESGTWEIEARMGVASEAAPPVYGDYSGGYAFLVERGGKTETITVDVNVIDGGGRTLMPGLIEGHVHMSTFLPLQAWARDSMHPYAHGAYAVLRGREMMMNGYTTVRDLGGPANYLREMYDAGHAIGPRVYPSENWITQTSGHGDFRELNDPHPALTGGAGQHMYENYVTMIADGPDEVTRATRETFRRGATQIKLFTSGGVTSLFDPLHSAPNLEEIKAAVAVAEQWGTYVATHSFTEKGILMSIEAGVKSIEHAPFLTDEAAKAMIENDLFLVTAVAPVLEVDVETARETYPPASFKKWSRVREAAETMMGVVADNPDLKFVFGTDLLGTIDNTKATDDKMNLEYKWWVDAIGEHRILTALTSTAGELMALSGQMNPYPDGPLGVISEGAYADLLLVDGNPFEDITVLENPDENFDIIMKDGVIYKNTLN